MALNSMIHNSFKDLEYLSLIDLVLDTGVNINNDLSYKTPLEGAAASFTAGMDDLSVDMFDKDSNGYIVIEYLLDRGADPTLVSRIHRTPLLMSKTHRQVLNFKYWTDLGVNPNIKDIHGNTALVNFMSKRGGLTGVGP